MYMKLIGRRLSLEVEDDRFLLGCLSVCVGESQSTRILASRNGISRFASNLDGWLDFQHATALFSLFPF